MSQDLTDHPLSVTMVDMEITSYAIENAEDAYNAYAAQAEDAPHKWGREQSEELARLAQNLRNLYDAEGTPEDDRIAL